MNCWKSADGMKKVMKYDMPGIENDSTQYLIADDSITAIRFFFFFFSNLKTKIETEIKYTSSNLRWHTLHKMVLSQN